MDILRKMFKTEAEKEPEWVLDGWNYGTVGIMQVLGGRRKVQRPQKSINIRGAGNTAAAFSQATMDR